MSTKLVISPSPHIRTSDSVARRMWYVVIAMLPAFAVGLLTFGLSALLLTVVCVAACIATEWCITKFVFHQPSTLANGSAVITGVLLAFNLPSILPWWMAVIGAVVAIGIGKMSFGGLGCNIWNPALVGRVFLLISFPAAMTTWPVGISVGTVDGTTGATFLATLKAQGSALSAQAVDWQSLALGSINGSMGEVSAAAILIGLAWMLITRVVTWHIPVAILTSAAVMSVVTGVNPLIDLMSGGLLLGAVFMATDYVTSPMTHKGQIIYGILIGAVCIIIRRYGAYPEGMSFAILLGNSVTPLINRYCRPRKYGEGRAARL